MLGGFLFPTIIVEPSSTIERRSKSLKPAIASVTIKTLSSRWSEEQT